MIAPEKVRVQVETSLKLPLDLMVLRFLVMTFAAGCVALGLELGLLGALRLWSSILETWRAL